jgi:hypothetical protein
MADIPDDLRDTSEDASRAAREAANALRRAVEAEAEKRERIERAKAGVEQLAGSAISFSRTLTENSGSMGKYGSAIDQAASGVGDLVSLLGPFGIVAGLLIKVVGKLVGQVLKTDDTLIQGYDKLAEMGGATAFSTDGLRDLALEMKWTVSDGAFTQLVDVVAEFGNNVTGLGTTAGVGIKNFMKIVEMEPVVREEFTRLGIGQKKVAQLQASYLANEIKLGGRRYKDNETLRKESLSYIRNLVELSALTGENIDEIKKRQENDLKDIGYNLALQERMQQKNGQQLKLNIQRGVELAGQVDEGSRKAVMEVVAKGSAVGPAAAALQQRFSMAGLDFVETVQSFEKGMIKEDEFRRRFQQANKATFEKLGKGFQLDAQGLSNVYAISAKTMEFQSKTIGENTSQQVKDDVKNVKDRKDEIKDGQVAIQDATTQLTRAFDEFIKLISGPVHAAFKGLIYSLQALTKGITKFVNFIGLAKNFGDKSKVDPTMPFAFDSIEELLDQQIESNKEMIRIEKLFKEKGTSPKSKFEDPNSVKALLKNPSLVKERYNYLEAEETYRGTTQQLEKLLGTEGYKKALEEREKNLREGKTKEEAANKEAAKNQQPKESATANTVGPPQTPTSTTTATVNTNEQPRTSTSAPSNGQQPTQKFMRGGIARNPNQANSLVSHLGGNAKIPLPNGINLPADVSLSEDLLSKLMSAQPGASNNTDIFASLQNAMQNMKIDAVPANFEMNSKNILRDTDNMDSITGNYAETLKKSIDNTIKMPEKSQMKSNNVNDILSVIVEKMDVLASKMNENVDNQYTTLLKSRR